MTYADFTASLQQTNPPADLPPLLKSLWWLGQGNWHRAHEIAQDIETSDGAWVHAHLHRAEGDTGNAAYWYRQAGKPVCRAPLDEEREDIVRSLLATHKATSSDKKRPAGN